MIEFYKGFRSEAHPMAIMVGVVGALSAFMHDDYNLLDPRDRQ
jgi:citrate synthase